MTTMRSACGRCRGGGSDRLMIASRGVRSSAADAQRGSTRRSHVCLDLRLGAAQTTGPRSAILTSSAVASRSASSSPRCDPSTSRSLLIGCRRGRNIRPEDRQVDLGDTRTARTAAPRILRAPSRTSSAPRWTSQALRSTATANRSTRSSNSRAGRRQELHRVGPCRGWRYDSSNRTRMQ